MPFRLVRYCRNIPVVCILGLMEKSLKSFYSNSSFALTLNNYCKIQKKTSYTPVNTKNFFFLVKNKNKLHSIFSVKNIFHKQLSSGFNSTQHKTVGRRTIWSDSRSGELSNFPFPSWFNSGSTHRRSGRGVKIIGFSDFVFERSRQRRSEKSTEKDLSVRSGKICWETRLVTWFLGIIEFVFIAKRVSVFSSRGENPYDSWIHCLNPSFNWELWFHFFLYIQNYQQTIFGYQGCLDGDNKIWIEKIVHGS